MAPSAAPAMPPATDTPPTNVAAPAVRPTRSVVVRSVRLPSSTHWSSPAAPTASTLPPRPIHLRPTRPLRARGIVGHGLGDGPYWPPR